MRKKVYLSKSNICDKEDALLVENELRKLQQTYDFDLVQFGGGSYTSADDKSLLACDILLVIPPREQDYDDDNYTDIGKGQYDQIEKFTDKTGSYDEGVYILDTAYRYRNSTFTSLYELEENDKSDYTRKYGYAIMDPHIDCIELATIIDETCYKLGELSGTIGNSPSIKMNGQSWKPSVTEINVKPMLAVSLL